jgi:hypothetical protein
MTRFLGQDEEMSSDFWGAYPRTRRSGENVRLTLPADIFNVGYLQDRDWDRFIPRRGDFRSMET